MDLRGRGACCRRVHVWTALRYAVEGIVDEGKEGHFRRTEYLLIKARHEVHPAVVLRPSCVPEKKWM